MKLWWNTATGAILAADEPGAPDRQWPDVRHLDGDVLLLIRERTSARIRNLTPHEVRLVLWTRDEETGDRAPESVLVLPAADDPPRVQIDREPLCGLAVCGDDGAGVVRLSATRVTSPPRLPEPDGTPLIVSRQVAEACPERGDLFVVDEAVRDDAGRVIAALGLASLASHDALSEYLDLRQRLQAQHMVRTL